MLPQLDHGPTRPERLVTPGAELIEGARLVALLGSSNELCRADQAWARHALLGVRMDLSPGDVLYARGAVSHYVYVLTSGLMQCHVQSDGLDRPATVSVVRAGDWIGLCDITGRHQESVHAAAHTSLLAFSRSELSAMSASSPLIVSLLARRVSLTHAKEGQVSRCPPGLPPYACTVVGLINLVYQLDPRVAADHQSLTMRVSLDVAMLSQWLGLPLGELQRCLHKLQLLGALCWDDNCIHDLAPQALFKASRTMDFVFPSEEADQPLVPAWQAPAPRLASQGVA